MPAADARLRELQTLKTIAETLNQTQDVREAIEATLRLVVDLMGLKTGWAFLVPAPDTRFQAIADYNLPPALAERDKRPIRQGGCLCLDLFAAGELSRAVNIVECSRLESARGDCGGLVYHASVPLRSEDRMLGILNVASPGRELFTEEDLQLLSAVGYQIGTAVERAQLYAAAQRRARQFRALAEAGRRLAAMLDADRLVAEVARVVVDAFDVPYCAVLLAEGGWRVRAAERRPPAGVGTEAGSSGEAAGVAGAPADGGSAGAGRSIRPGRGLAGWAAAGRPLLVKDVRQDRRFARDRGLSGEARAVLAVPIVLGGRSVGALHLESPEPGAFDELDLDATQSLAAHAAIALETVRLAGERAALAAVEERNRLARDLHDSVTQALFSMTLTAEAARAVLDEAPAAARELVADLQALASEALREMRALLEQLRPPSADVRTTLERYWNLVRPIDGPALEFSGATGDGLPAPVAETLIRVGQEALNNAAKHARARTVKVDLRVRTHPGGFPGGARLSVSDDGVGFVPGDRRLEGRFGLAIMAERCRALGGRVRVVSVPGRGTRVIARVPCTGAPAAPEQSPPARRP